ncbi:MAG: S8 family serine peptidase [Verrucomicrobia bacterium]|nr:S8 family serine peptidase [Verrucomicrobiota bacterium]
MPSAGVAQSAASAQQPFPVVEYRADRMLIMPRAGVSPRALAEFHTAQQTVVLRRFEGLGGLEVLQLPLDTTVADFITSYERSGLVAFAEPEYARQLALSPNDPYFASGALWGLNNDGQSGGVADADIDAPEGWDVLTSASNIIVAVLDTGIRHTHEDLAANLWAHPLDGSPGWNALTGTNNPVDGDGHGTLVSGIIGAEGDNGKGATGVAWRVRLMAGKCFNTLGEVGFDSDIITCLEFARTHGARMVNASFSGTAFSHSLSNAIATARAAGIILVAAAGNNASDLNMIPRYPACYDLDNIVSVAATTRNDELWSSSNFGATSVDLAAPGHQIYSTFFLSDGFYLGPVSGTSLAAAYVSGTFALMLARFPAETHQQIIARVLDATDRLPALVGRCATGGRLNLRKALSPPVLLSVLPTGPDEPFQLRVAAGPNRSCVIESTTGFTGWTSVFTNTTSAAGFFDFTDLQPPDAPQRFFRATAGF